ncbi:MAG: hypothetical protein U0168_09035 [Nannocystaceae bacterium]
MSRYDGCAVNLGRGELEGRQRTPLRIARLQFPGVGVLGARRPVAVPSCEILSKGSDPALPLPDLVLGLLGDFALSGIRAQREEVGERKKKRKTGDQASNRYEQISHKVKAIYDLPSGVVYSRRNPFSPWAPSETATG